VQRLQINIYRTLIFASKKGLVFFIDNIGVDNLSIFISSILLYIGIDTTTGIIIF